MFWALCNEPVLFVDNAAGPLTILCVHGRQGKTSKLPAWGCSAIVRVRELLEFGEWAKASHSLNSAKESYGAENYDAKDTMKAHRSEW